MRGIRKLNGLFRHRVALSADELQAYAEAVGPLIEQLGALYLRWRQSLELDTSDEELANAGSIQRWQAAGLRNDLRRITPPPALARPHADLVVIATNTARASQLLSNGYRFHSSGARCDGHALLLSTEERFAALRTELERQGFSVDHGPADAERSG
jgi:hypothetical protein